MIREYIPIDAAIKQAKKYDDRLSPSAGICTCYEVENMGFCKDGKSRWYHFISVNGTPAYTIKY